MIIMTLILKFFLGLAFLFYKIVFAVFAGIACAVMGIIAAVIGGSSKSHYSSRIGKKESKPIEKKPLFSDEEILATGLYPKDEGYRMYLISKILDK